MRSTTGSRRRRPRWVWVAFCWVPLLSCPAVAELALLVGGGVVKIESYELEDDRIELVLPSGGVLSLALERVERIVEDEIEEEPRQLPRNFGIRVDFPAAASTPNTPFGEEIFRAAQRHSINPELVAAIVRTESAFDPRAVSDKGAVGLMQLMPSTARRFGLEMDWVFDPQRNLDAGVRYLRWLVDRFEGDLSLALAGYNAGESTVERYRGVPPYRETREYIWRVYSAATSELDASDLE